MLRQGELHDEAVHVVVFVELLHAVQKFCFGDSVFVSDEAGTKTARLTRQHLVAHISFATSVVAHEHGCQMRPLAAGGNDLFYFGFDLGFDGGRSCFTVDECHI